MNADTAQRYARWAAGLYAITIVAGGFGESYVPDMLIVGNDVARTAHQLAISIGTFRAGFVAYLVEAACDITLNMLLYALLKPVNRHLALLAVGFGLMGTAVFAAGELVYFSAALPVVDSDVARAISPDAKMTLTYLCLTIYSYVNGIFAEFYGIAALIRGYLMWRSGYLPRALGAIFMVGGAGFLAKNFLIVVTPQYDTFYVLLPMMLAMASWVVWLLIKGIDRNGWEAMQAASAGR